MERIDKSIRPMFVVVDRDGMVFSGMKDGYYDWSHNWVNAKPLYKENTEKLLAENPGAELMKESDIL
jgi:hypothetical protein